MAKPLRFDMLQTVLEPTPVFSSSKTRTYGTDNKSGLPSRRLAPAPRPYEKENMTCDDILKIISPYQDVKVFLKTSGEKRLLFLGTPLDYEINVRRYFLKKYINRTVKSLETVSDTLLITL